MNQNELLALYDSEMRQHIEYHDSKRDASAHAVRHTSLTDEGGFVLHSTLDAATVECEIEAQIAYFEAIGSDFEWKVFDYDEPPDLRQRLVARGFESDESEAIMVLDLDEAPASLFEPVTAPILHIQEQSTVADVAIVEEAVWQQDYSYLVARLIRDLSHEQNILDLYIAYIEGKPASTGWIYYHPGTSFASLWGGSTMEQYRGFGLYSALLAVRAQKARRRGFRLLTVDASPMSEPILCRHGFQILTYAHACTWQVGSNPAQA